MKSALKWGSLCLAVYILFLIIKLPATLVLSNVPVDKNIRISGISGTIWNGHAQRIQAYGLPISKVNWSLSFLPLLWGEISADIKAGNIRDAEQISANGHISFSGQSVEADDLLTYIPTDLVISMLPLPIPVQADGRFKVQLDELDYQDGCQALAGTGQWLNANFTGTTGVIELGNFDAGLSCQNNNVIVDVKLPNSFGLTARATVPANMKFTIEGRFKPDANLPKEVHQAAQFFGKPDNDGFYPIKF